MNRALARTLFLISILTPLAVPQDFRGRVQGVITDTSNAAIAQATITLLNTNTKNSTIRMTDEHGHYLFDYVEPGTYNLTAEGTGFGKYQQENLQVLVRSDLTVNAVLKVGDVNQTITVVGAAVEIQFNTTTLSQTIDGTMLKELPVLARNAFTLALLDPAVVNRYSDISKRNPFYQLSTTGVDVGGQTSGRNEVQIDGSPIGVGSRGSYSPPMDAVQEFTVQQNSVDAESGFSAGGVLNVGMKAGTNEYHGSLYYFGRNPSLNAVSNAFTRSPNVVRNHVGGGTIGGPILKNKLFSFFTYEKWNNRQPYTKVITLPTDLEREGDFTQTLTKSGALRAIFDPSTTVTNSPTTATRQPFAGNRVPASRMDVTSRLFLNDIWKPNNPGDDLTGINNYRTGYAWFLNYWNLSNRTDWNITPKWKIFARYSVIRTRLDNNNYGNSPATTSDNGGLMDALNGAFDSVYTLSARTTFNFRLGVVYSEDEYDSDWAKLGEAGLAKYWPNNPWYKPYTADSPAVYYPNLNIGGATFGKSSWWSYRPRKYSYQGSMGHDRGRHYMKFGMAYRHGYEYSQLPNLGTFPFVANTTANTYIAPDLLNTGSAWATFLLGSIDNSLVANYVSPRYTKQDQYGLFFQNDFKLNRRITLNLGLRWEYETAPSEREGRMARYLDLNNPIPEFQSNPPAMPPQVATIQGAPKPIYNGAWLYTDGDNPGLYRAPRTSFLPRLGVAIRANDKTAIRIGYARYAVPLMSVLGYSWILPSTDGYSTSSNGPLQVQGIPQGVFTNPFPASNPLVLPVGRGNGRNTNLGSTGTTSWANQNLKIPMNDRFNFTLERDLAWGFKVDGTFFMNFGHNMVPEGQGGNAGFGQSLNLMDPQLGYTYKTALSAPVTNPFFGLPPSLMPGQLRGQPTVALSTLLKPYPQYGALTQTFMPGVDNRYKALQLRVQRRFAQGYSVVWGYNYNRETTGAFFNDPDQYANKLTMIPAASPRHRVTLATTIDLPFGRNRRFASQMHPVLNAILGGWSTSHIYMWNSGSFLRFGQLDVSGDPLLADPTWQRWFNTAAFKQATAFTPRTNPYQYDGLTGPQFWQLDSTLSKNFALTEKFKLEFRLEGYNLTNSVMPANPNLTVTSTQFGGITGQVNYGREVQYTLRLHF